jgi:hypothetical protein
MNIKHSLAFGLQSGDGKLGVFRCSATLRASEITVPRRINVSRIPISTALVAAVLSIVAAAPKASADEYDKKTIVTFDAPVEVPGGVVLQPGKYVFILQNSENDRHIVLVKDEREKQTYAQIFATNDFHIQQKSKSQFLFWESPAGQPQLLRAWFYPGERYGQAFLYKKDRAAEIKRAQKNHEEVPFETEGTGKTSSSGDSSAAPR